MDMNDDDDNGSFSEMSYKCMAIIKPSLELLQIKHKRTETQREERVLQPAVSLAQSWPTLDGTASGRLSCIQGWMWVVLQKPK